MKVAKPEFRADIMNSATCCSLLELGRFSRGYKTTPWSGVLWESEWKETRSPNECFFGVTNSRTQKGAEKSLKKMGFKVKAKWKNGDGQTLRMWVYTYKPTKKKRRKK